MRKASLVGLGLLAAASLGACSPTPAAVANADLRVTAAFYPLEFAAEQVGGSHVSITSLTKPGVEPHDVELTAQAVADVSDADVVLYLSTFQPAVDQAVKNQARGRVFDAASAADLEPVTAFGSAGGDEHADEEGDGHEDESDEEHAEDDPESLDPHFWLDPVRYAAVVKAIGDEFAAADPAHADGYRARATDLADRLGGLDGEYSDGLATCASREVVTGHAAFGYLTQRYDLTQDSILGVSPDAEPTAKQLIAMIERVRATQAGTIYAETLIDPAVANAVAAETGTKVAVLDPIEGITNASAGSDYLAVMRANLKTLKTGQECQ